MPDDEIVALNVGGKEFSTSKQTLQKVCAEGLDTLQALSAQP